MSICINKNSVEFRALEQRSGLPESYLAAICADFQERLGRFPHLDEIKGVDSSNYLTEELNIKRGITKEQQIYRLTGKNDLQSSQVWINDNFRDLEVEFSPFFGDIKVYITHRPITQEISTPVSHSKISDTLVVEEIVSKLRDVYGLPVESVITEDLNEYKESPIFSEGGITYVNADAVTLDTPVIELIPLLSTSLHGTELYDKLIKDNEKEFSKELRNRIIDKSEKLQFLPTNVQYELMYNMKRVLDSILMGESSIRDINDDILFNSTLRSLARIVNSKIDVSNSNILSLDLEEKHKQLMEEGKVTEYCHV